MEVIEINGFEKHRRKAGLRQVEVAELLRVAQCTISAWERGVSRPRAALLPEISRLYDCSIEQLLEEVES